MKQYLFLTSALLVLSGGVEAACIQTPSCSSLGYTSSQSCNGGVKCPFGNAWNCTASDLSTQITELTNKITEQTNTITNLETQITEIKKEVTTSNCLVGDILYSDMSCNAVIVASKKPIGVVFDRANRLAMALDMARKAWSDEYFDVPTLSNYGLSSEITADWQGKNNTRLVLEYCQANGKSCPAFEYVNSYKTEGTLAGDWYLPAAGELNVIYGNMGVLNTALGKIDGTKIPTDWHWSSSESSYNAAWFQDFDNGDISRNNKGNTFYVRPVLAF